MKWILRQSKVQAEAGKAILPSGVHPGVRPEHHRSHGSWKSPSNAGALCKLASSTRCTHVAGGATGSGEMCLKGRGWPGPPTGADRRTRALLPPGSSPSSPSWPCLYSVLFLPSLHPSPPPLAPSLSPTTRVLPSLWRLSALCWSRGCPILLARKTRGAEMRPPGWARSLRLSQGLGREGFKFWLCAQPLEART